MFQGHPQAPVVLVFNRYETERLQNAIGHPAHGAENLGHAMHGARLRLEGNFDEISFAERLIHAQKAAGHGDGLELGFGAAAVFQANGR